jgi:hypothetical protein
MIPYARLHGQWSFVEDEVILFYVPASLLVDGGPARSGVLAGYAEHAEWKRASVGKPDVEYDVLSLLGLPFPSKS